MGFTAKGVDGGLASLSSALRLEALGRNGTHVFFGFAGVPATPAEGAAGRCVDGGIVAIVTARVVEACLFYKLQRAAMKLCGCDPRGRRWWCDIPAAGEHPCHARALASFLGQETLRPRLLSPALCSYREIYFASKHHNHHTCCLAHFAICITRPSGRRREEETRAYELV